MRRFGFVATGIVVIVGMLAVLPGRVVSAGNSLQATGQVGETASAATLGQSPATAAGADRDSLEASFLALAAERAKAMSIAELQEAVGDEKSLPQREFDRALAILKKCAKDYPETAVGRRAIQAKNILNEPDVKAVPWDNFSDARLVQLLGAKKNVLIQFSADWCMSCKVNERTVNSDETLGLIKQHGLVPVYADWTQDDAAIRKCLERFDSISVPLTVIIPAGDIEHPIILRDRVTQGVLSHAIRRAFAEDK